MSRFFYGGMKYDTERHRRSSVSALRDYFAGQALSNANGSDMQEIARSCYLMADAMLEERKK